MEEINIKVSVDGYLEKPGIEELKKISWLFKNDFTNKNLNYEQIAAVLKNGHSVLLADYKSKCNSINEEYINSLSCIALDIDSKEHKIDMYAMISLIFKKFGVYPIINYRTFSDTDYTRFRLIYRLANKIDVETYRSLYKALSWKLKQLDSATCNPNRVWGGTNKEVIYNGTDIPFNFHIISKIIRSYNKKLERDQSKIKIVNTKSYENIEEDSYIKTEHKEEVLNMLIQNIDLRHFIPNNFGGTYKNYRDSLQGACVLHGGDNKEAMLISKDRYTCFTHCGSGNIITVAKRLWGGNFSSVAIKLAEQYNLYIPKEYTKEV